MILVKLRVPISPNNRCCTLQALVFTHHVKDGQCKKKIVKDSVNSLAPEGPNGNSIAYESNYAKDKDQQSFSDPLEVVKSHFLQMKKKDSKLRQCV